MQITQGDALILRVQIRTGESGPAINLSGASFLSKFPAAAGGLVEMPNSAHAIEDQSTNLGWVDIAFTAEQSALLKTGKFLSFSVKVTQGSAVKHFHSIKGLTVLSASPIEQIKPQSNVFLGSGL